jgi:hypothetical protein
MDGGRTVKQVVGQMLHLCIGQTNVTFLAIGQTKVVASQGWANVMVRQTSCLCIGQTNITILA